jgi:hypothetical protein
MNLGAPASLPAQPVISPAGMPALPGQDPNASSKKDGGFP